MLDLCLHEPGFFCCACPRNNEITATLVLARVEFGVSNGLSPVSFTPGFPPPARSPPLPSHLRDKNRPCILHCVQYCCDYCAGEGDAFCATQYGVECWCSDEVQLVHDRHGDATCTYPCPGDKTEVRKTARKQTLTSGHSMGGLAMLVWPHEKTWIRVVVHTHIATDTTTR